MGQPLAIFTFNDGTPTDVSGNNAAVIRRGVPNFGPWADGRMSMLVDGGAGLRVSVDINPAARPRLTMGGWVRSSAANPIRHFLSHDNMGFDRNLGIDSRGGPGWSAFTGAGVVGPLPASVGTWQFVAAVYDDTAGTVLLYVDGEVRQALGRPGSGYPHLDVGISPCCDIGIAGVIDDVFVLGQALSVARLDEIYQGGVSKVPDCTLIYASPFDRTICPGATTTFDAEVAGSGVVMSHWEVRLPGGAWTAVVDGATPHGAVISGANTPSLTIEGADREDEAEYRCVATNACATPAASVPAFLNICTVDINCDGFLDFFDYNDYVDAFETGEPRADFNRDGFIDFFDYDDFVFSFEQGC